MRARHIFWRDATGGPSKEEKWAPEHVLAELGKQAQINSGGTAQWGSWDLHKYFTVVRNKVVVVDDRGDELNGHDAWSIVSRAMSEIVKRDGGGQPIAPGRLISKGNELARKFLAQPSHRYHLVSSLSVGRVPFCWTSVGGCRMSPLRNRNCYPLPSVLESTGSDPIRRHLARTRYQLLRVEVTGRTAHEAVDTALAAASHLRAMWNLMATVGSWVFSAAPSPLGVIHAGPVHTLHLTNGEPADDTYWYEPSFAADQRVFTADAKTWARIERGRKWITKRIRAIPYGAELKRLLSRYVQAIDSPDLDVAFLHMWGLLEHVTGTVGARYDDTIKRAVRVMSPRETAMEMVDAVRCRRNQYVHSAGSARDGDQIAYLVKSFVDPHLLCLLRNDFGVTSIEEYGDLLGLPADCSALRERCRKLSQQLKSAKKMVEFDGT